MYWPLPRTRFLPLLPRRALVIPGSTLRVAACLYLLRDGGLCRNLRCRLEALSPFFSASTLSNALCVQRKDVKLDASPIRFVSTHMAGL
jgi:hypothetical protein